MDRHMLIRDWSMNVLCEDVTRVHMRSDILHQCADCIHLNSSCLPDWSGPWFPSSRPMEVQRTVWSTAILCAQSAPDTCLVLLSTDRCHCALLHLTLCCCRHFSRNTNYLAILHFVSESFVKLVSDWLLIWNSNEWRSASAHLQTSFNTWPHLDMSHWCAREESCQLTCQNCNLIR